MHSITAPRAAVQETLSLWFTAFAAQQDIIEGKHNDSLRMSNLAKLIALVPESKLLACLLSYCLIHISPEAFKKI